MQQRQDAEDAMGEKKFRSKLVKISQNWAKSFWEGD